MHKYKMNSGTGGFEHQALVCSYMNLVWQKVTSLLLWADVNLLKWDLISHLIRRIIALIGCFEWENCPANDQETAGPHWVIVAGGLFLSAWWGSIWYEAQRRVSVIAIACMCPSDPLSLFMLGNVRPIAEHRLLVWALSCRWIGSTQTTDYLGYFMWEVLSLKNICIITWMLLNPYIF